MTADIQVAEQVQASNPAISAWVGANAGSGKTRVLVQRMLRLLLEDIPPASILCLTFTRAAAVEMRRRLFATLGPWVCMDDKDLKTTLHNLLGAPPNAKQMRTARLLFARVLDIPGELRIQTIHAFCEHLLGRFPIEAGVPAQFHVLDEHKSRELRLSVRNRILRSISTSTREQELADAVATICADITEEDFSGLLAAIDNNRQQIRDLLPNPAAVDRCINQINAALNIQADDTPDALEAQIANPDARAALLEAAGLLQHQSAETFAAKGEQIETFLASPPASRLKDYLDAFFTAAGAPRKRLAPAAMLKERPDLDALLHAEQTRLQNLRQRHDDLMTAQRSCAVVLLSYRMVAGFAEEKQRQGALDFDDLIEYAARLLHDSRQAAWVLYKLDEGISHILIDEAQDTSPRQWKVIAALAQEFFSGLGSEAGEKTRIPRSLFAVGDEKQSIFRFQGADLEVYDGWREQFGTRVADAQMSWQEVPLQLSFRSTPEVLQAVDYLFARQNGAAEHNQLWQSVTKSREDIRHQPHRTQEHGLVELWDCLRPDPDSQENSTPDYWNLPSLSAVAGNTEETPRARLARRIAAKIGTWLDTGARLESRPHPIRPQDILILVQRRDGFVEEMIRALKQKRIPVAGSDRMNLTAHLAVMDLLALARFCLLPEDDLSLAETLKSPLFALNDDDLFRIAHARTGSLWHSLQQHAEQDPRLATCADRLSKLHQQAGEHPPFAFFHRLLVAGGREQLLQRLGPDAADPLDAFLDQLRAYERDHTPSLQGFLRWLELAPIEIKRDQDSARNEVRVMTVHGAKGLESDIVFLPDTCRKTGSWHHDPTLFFGDYDKHKQPPLIWAPAPRWDVAFSQQERTAFREQEQKENMRLLYVAMTRARDRLYICGHTNREPSEHCWYSLCRAALTPHMQPIAQEQEDEQQIWRLGAEPDEPPAPPRPAAAARPAPTPRPPPAPRTLSVPKHEEIIVPLAPSQAFAAHDQKQTWAEESKRIAARRRGTILHEALRHLSTLDASQRDKSSADAIVAALAAGTPLPERNKMSAALLRVMSSKQCRPLFQSPGRNEVPISAMLPFPDAPGAPPRPRRISAQVDRLCFPSQTEVVAVEYKSDRRPPKTLDAIKPAYLTQVGIYHRLLQSLWPHHKIRCGILWIETATFMEIPPEHLADTLHDPAP